MSTSFYTNLRFPYVKQTRAKSKSRINKIWSRGPIEKLFKNAFERKNIERYDSMLVLLDQKRQIVSEVFKDILNKAHWDDKKLYFKYCEK